MVEKYSYLLKKFVEENQPKISYLKKRVALKILIQRKSIKKWFFWSFARFTSYSEKVCSLVVTTPLKLVFNWAIRTENRPTFEVAQFHSVFN